MMRTWITVCDSQNCQNSRKKIIFSVNWTIRRNWWFQSNNRSSASSFFIKYNQQWTNRNTFQLFPFHHVPPPKLLKSNQILHAHKIFWFHCTKLANLSNQMINREWNICHENKNSSQMQWCEIDKMMHFSSH